MEGVVGGEVAVEERLEVRGQGSEEAEVEDHLRAEVEVEGEAEAEEEEEADAGGTVRGTLTLAARITLECPSSSSSNCLGKKLTCSECSGSLLRMATPSSCLCPCRGAADVRARRAHSAPYGPVPLRRAHMRRAQ